MTTEEYYRMISVMEELYKDAYKLGKCGRFDPETEEGRDFMNKSIRCSTFVKRLKFD